MLHLIRKHLILSLGVCLCLGALIWAFLPQPILVRTASVELAPMGVYVSAEGQTRIKDLYVMSVPVTGTMSRIDLDVGDSVTKEDVLAYLAPLSTQGLDPRAQQRAEAEVDSARAALSAAKAEVEAAQALADLAHKDLARAQQLHSGKAAAETRLDNARFDAASADAKARSARFRGEVAAHQLQSAEILAHYAHTEAAPDQRLALKPPVNGTVIRILREHSGPVQTGEPLLEIGDPGAIEVSVDVLSADAVKITPGTKVLFERWGGEHPLDGVVTRVEPVGFTDVSALGVEEQRVFVICALISPPEQWQRLGSGYRVEARFQIWHTPQTLQVPSSCLFRRDEHNQDSAQWWVYTVEENRATLRQVRIGRHNDLKTQIINGLARGETIINHPGEDIKDGTRVKIRVFK